MANAQVYQTKLKRLVFENETTVGTAETLDADSITIPAYDVSIDRGRGTQQIDRAATLDGFPGAQKNVPGSFGTNLSFNAEIHDTTEVLPIWGRLLLGCGFRALDDTASTVTFYPSTNQIDGIGAGPAYDPNSLTLGVATFIDAEDDVEQETFGATGACTWTLASGERPVINYTFVGKNQGDFITAVATSDFGDNTVDSAEMTNLPIIVKGITATISGVDPIALSTMEVSWNQETPDVLDPTEADGFAVSPVLWQNGPTVTFTIGANQTNNTQFFQKFKSGATASIDIVMDSGAGFGGSRQIQIFLEQVQFQGVSWGDANGYETYEIEAKVVRDAGEDYDTAGSEAKIVWTYA